MDANTANENRQRTPRTSSRPARTAKSAHGLIVSRPATNNEMKQIREWLGWFRANNFTYSMLEHDLGKSGGWCNKVVRDVDRYDVTNIDIAVVRASYRSALRLHNRQQHKYQLMQSIIVKAGGIMRDVEALADEA